MALHRLTRIVMGVPNVAEVPSYYREFGLSPASEPHHFATVDGGEQLRIVPAVSRRLVQLGVGTDDLDGSVASRRHSTGSALRARGQTPASRPSIPAPGCRSGSRSMTGLCRNPPPSRSTTRQESWAGQEPVPTASCARRGSDPANSGTLCSAPPTRTLRRDSSSTGWASKSVTPFPVWPHSCGARPTTTTSWFSRLRCRSCTTPRGRSTTSTMWDAGRPRCSSRPGSAHLGPRAPLHWIELLLVPEGSRRQFQRVLLRHGLHRRRCAPETRRVGRIELAVFVGSTAPAVLPRPRGSRRDDDRSS